MTFFTSTTWVQVCHLKQGDDDDDGDGDDGDDDDGGGGMFQMKMETWCHSPLMMNWWWVWPAWRTPPSASSSKVRTHRIYLTVSLTWTLLKHFCKINWSLPKSPSLTFAKHKCCHLSSGCLTERHLMRAEWRECILLYDGRWIRTESPEVCGVSS